MSQSISEEITTSSSAGKVHLISLGCARNLVDAEVMLGGLVKKGWQITQQPEDADAIVVNTCGFIGPAKEESIDTIIEAGQHKQANPDMQLIVTGCLTQRYKSQLVKGLPEVDLFIGTDEFAKLPELIDQKFEREKLYSKRTNYLYDGDLPKLNTLGKAMAYVKVAEGCQHNCAFCIIPAIRGPLRSRPIASVVAEVERLAEQGVKEINLIAQDLAAYGRDLNEDQLLPLLRELVKVDGIEWIRMLYVYPENISDEFLEFFATEPKLVKYLDIPMQHGSDAVLKRMNRDVTRAQLIDTVKRVRATIPGMAVRTTVMVGFPGETDSEFLELRDFVKEMRFDHLGCFAYSQEEGTVAGRMPDQVDEDIKRERLDRVMSLQRSISYDVQQEKVGRVFPVLVTGLSKESDLLFEGRLPIQAPEVDGVVYINDGPAKPGTIQYVEISEAHDYDLVGHIVPAPC